MVERGKRSALSEQRDNKLRSPKLESQADAENGSATVLLLSMLSCPSAESLPATPKTCNLRGNFKNRILGMFPGCVTIYTDEMWGFAYV